MYSDWLEECSYCFDHLLSGALKFHLNSCTHQNNESIPKIWQILKIITAIQEVILKKQTLWISFLFMLFIFSPVAAQNKPVGIKEVYNFVSLQNLNQPNTTLCRMVIAEAFKRNGLKTTFKSFPNKRSLEMVETGEADGDLLRRSDISWKNYVPIDEPLYKGALVAFSVREDILVQSWEDLDTKKYRIGYLAGNIIAKKMIEKKNQIDERKNVIVLTDDINAFKMLLEDRFDIFIYGIFPSKKVFQKRDFLSEGVRLAGTIDQFYIISYLNVMHKNLAPIIAETIREMKKDGTYNRIKKIADFNF